MTSARRAAARVNAFLPTYYVALQRTIESKIEHDRAFEQAQRLADELVQVSQGTLKRYNESWEDCKVLLHETDKCPASTWSLKCARRMFASPATQATCRMTLPGCLWCGCRTTTAGTANINGWQANRKQNAG